jgi:hypothetical protein
MNEWAKIWRSGGDSLKPTGGYNGGAVSSGSDDWFWWKLYSGSGDVNDCSIARLSPVCRSTECRNKFREWLGANVAAGAGICERGDGEQWDILWICRKFLQWEWNCGFLQLHCALKGELRGREEEDEERIVVICVDDSLDDEDCLLIWDFERDGTDPGVWS